MKNSESVLESAGETYGYIKAYISQQVEYYKLDIAERLSRAISSAITMVVLLLLFLMMLGFFSLAAGFYLAQEFGSNIKGFLVIGGVYLGLTFLFAVFRRYLITDPVLSRVIKVFFQDH